MSSRRQFIGGSVAMTAVSLVAAAPGRAAAGSWDGSLRIDAFVYEAGQPLAIEAARVAASQAVPVRVYDSARAAELGRELEPLAGRGTGAIAGLTSGAGFAFVSALAAARGWSLRHSAPAGASDLLHWVVGPGRAKHG